MEERKLYRLPVNKNGRPRIRCIPVHKIMLRMIEQRAKLWERDLTANAGVQRKGFKSGKIVELSLRRKVKSKIDRESE